MIASTMSESFWYMRSKILWYQSWYPHFSVFFGGGWGRPNPSNPSHFWAGDITLHCRSSRPPSRTVHSAAGTADRPIARHTRCTRAAPWQTGSAIRCSSPQFAPSTAPLGAKTRRETLFALRNLEVKGPANLMNAGQTSTRNCVKWFWMKWCEGFMDDSH